MKTVKLFLLLTFVSLLAACQEYGSADYTEAKQSEPYSPEQYELPQEEEGLGEKKLQGRILIKNAQIQFQVKNFEESLAHIRVTAENYQGFVAQMYQNTTDDRLQSSLTVRVPVEKLDTFLLEVEKISLFTHHKQVSSEDVTEEFLDISTRLNTKKAVRDRYIAILRDKATTVQDILDAEDKIRVIQEEIESIEGRLRYLKNKSSLSTVQIEIYQETESSIQPPLKRERFGYRLKSGLSAGWELMLSLVVGLVTFWPFVLLFSLVLLVFLRRRMRKRS